MTPPDTTLADSLRASVLQLAVLREAVAQRAEAIAKKRIAFESTLLDDLIALEADKRAVEAEESGLRGMAQIVADQTGNRKPAPGVEVVGKTSYTISDTAAALAWAKKTGLALVPESVDEKALLAFAKAGQPFEFVTVEEGLAVKIATDLTAALAKAAA
jgi:hypothetical protein